MIVQRVQDKTIEFPLEVRTVRAHEMVAEDQGKVSLEYGLSSMLQKKWTIPAILMPWLWMRERLIR